MRPADQTNRKVSKWFGFWRIKKKQEPKGKRSKTKCDSSEKFLKVPEEISHVELEKIYLEDLAVEHESYRCSEEDVRQ